MCKLTTLLNIDFVTTSQRNIIFQGLIHPSTQRCTSFLPCMVNYLNMIMNEVQIIPKSSVILLIYVQLISLHNRLNWVNTLHDKNSNITGVTPPPPGDVAIIKLF